MKTLNERDEIVSLIKEALPSFGWPNPMNPFPGDVSNARYAQSIAEGVYEAVLPYLREDRGTLRFAEDSIDPSKSAISSHVGDRNVVELTEGDGLREDLDQLIHAYLRDPSGFPEFLATYYPNEYKEHAGTAIPAQDTATLSPLECEPASSRLAGEAGEPGSGRSTPQLSSVSSPEVNLQSASVASPTPAPLDELSPEEMAAIGMYGYGSSAHCSATQRKMEESASDLMAEDAAKLRAVTRFEVIDTTGRRIVYYGTVEPSFQDDGRTLKVFVPTELRLPEKQDGLPAELSQSVRLPLNAAMSLTRKYLEMVGVQEIGNLQIAELREVHYQVRNALADLERASGRESGWQDIATAPRDGTHILVYGLRGWGNDYESYEHPTEAIVAYWREDVEWWEVPTVSYYCDTVQPTHWMSLPQPPRGDRG